MGKISSYSEDTTPAAGDFLLGENVSAVSTNKFKLSVLATLFASLTNTKTTDANGWTVYTNGTWTQYRKRMTFSQFINSAQVLTLSSSNLPAGMSSLGTNFIDSNFVFGGNAYDFSVHLEMGTSSTSIVATITIVGGANTATGFVDVTITSP